MRLKELLLKASFVFCCKIEIREAGMQGKGVCFPWLKVNLNINKKRKNIIKMVKTVINTKSHLKIGIIDCLTVNS